MENTNLTISEHRQNTIIEILKKLQNNDRVCCVRYTNYGKTYWVIRPIINMFPNKKFLLLAPLDSLKQGFESIFTQPNVQIYLYQNLLKLTEQEISKKFKDIDYIICDECHHLGENKWAAKVEEIFNIINNGNTKIIGLTASPLRGDGVDVTKTFFKGCETSRFEMLSGIMAGYLPKIEYYIGQCVLTERQKKLYDEKMNDVDRYEVDKLLDIPYWIKKFIDDDRLDSNLKVVVFVPYIKDIDTAEKSCIEWFCKAFPDKIIKTFKYHSNLSKKENENNFRLYSEDIDENTIDILISRDKASEGTHLENCSVAILLRATKSPTVYVQQIGRAVNKRKAIVFDFINNYDKVNLIRKEIKELEQERTNISQSKRYKKMFYDSVNIHFNNIDLLESKFMSEDLLSIENNDNYKDYIDKNINILTYGEICKNLHITTQSLLQYCRNHGLKPLTSSDIIDSIKDELLQDYNNGYSIVKLSTKYKISDKYIHDYLEDIGILKEYHINVPDSDLNNLITMYEKNISYTEMSRKTGYSVSTIKRVLEKNLGILKPRVPMKHTKIDRDKICELYKNLKSIKQVSNEIGLSTYIIRNVLNDENIKLYREPKKVELSDFDCKEICKKYLEGSTIKSICDEYGIGAPRVNKILDEYYIEKRDNTYIKYDDLNDIMKSNICNDYLNIDIKKSSEKYITSKYNISTATMVKVLTENNMYGNKQKLKYSSILQEKDTIIDMYTNLKTPLHKIASTYHCDSKTIKDILSNSNIDITRFRWDSDIIKLFKEGYTIKEIAIKLNIGVSKIESASKRNNIQYNTKNKRNKRSKGVELVLNNKDYILDNMDIIPQYEIAKKLGISESTFRTAVKKANIGYKNTCRQAFQLTDDKRKNVLNLFNSGYKIPDIRKQLNMTTHELKLYLSDLNLNGRERERERYSLNQEEKSFIHNNPDLTISQIAYKLKRTNNGIIRNYVIKNNLPNPMRMEDIK